MMKRKRPNLVMRAFVSTLLIAITIGFAMVYISSMPSFGARAPEYYVREMSREAVYLMTWASLLSPGYLACFTAVWYLVRRDRRERQYENKRKKVRRFSTIEKPAPPRSRCLDGGPVEKITKNKPQSGVPI